MKQYILLLKGKGDLDYSEESLQKRINEYRSWVNDIKPLFVADNRLKREGIWIKNEDEIYTDGPFLESKEIIAGYIVIESKNIEEALFYAKSCPLLKYFEIYVRPIV